MVRDRDGTRGRKCDGERVRVMCPDGLSARFSSKKPEFLSSKFLLICQKEVQEMARGI